MESYYAGLTAEQTKLVDMLMGVASSCGGLASDATADGAAGVKQIVLSPAAYAEFARLAAWLAEGWAEQVKARGADALARALRDYKRRPGRPRKGSSLAQLASPTGQSAQSKVGRPKKYGDDDKQELIDIVNRAKARLASERGVPKSKITDVAVFDAIERTVSPGSSRYTREAETKRATKLLSRFRKELAPAAASKKSRNSR